MTIMEGQSVELQIHLTVLSKVSKIKFSFDNEKAISENFFSISPSEIISPPVLGKIDLSYKITIQCLKPFAKELRLEARAYSHNDLKVNQHDTNAIIFPQLCGAIKLLPNDISHQRKISVVFISVKTNISGMPLMGIAPSSTAEVDILKKYLGQAYVKADVITETLDLIDSLTQKTDNRYLSCCQQINGQYIGVDYSKRNELQEFLLIKTPNKYEHYFKIFFIPDRCPGLNGFSSGDKFTVCFSTALAETPSHELLHSLGLPHTFDGSTSRAKYIYQDGKTDNIMDYSHFVGVSRHSLFHWQWKAININL